MFAVKSPYFRMKGDVLGDSLSSEVALSFFIFSYANLSKLKRRMVLSIALKKVLEGSASHGGSEGLLVAAGPMLSRGKIG